MKTHSEYTLQLMFHSTVSIHTSSLIISIRRAHDGTVHNISYLVQHDVITGDRRTAPLLPRTAPSLPSFLYANKMWYLKNLGQPENLCCRDLEALGLILSLSDSVLKMLRQKFLML